MGLRLGEPFPRSLIYVLPHWSSEFIPGSDKFIPGARIYPFSDLLEGRQDVAAHHSQSEHAPRVRSRSGNVFYGVGLEAATLSLHHIQLMTSEFVSLVHI